jgi:hypothetical protein
VKRRGSLRSVFLDIDPIGSGPRLCERKASIFIQDVMAGELLLKQRPRIELAVAAPIGIQSSANDNHMWSVPLELLPECTTHIADDPLLA